MQNSRTNPWARRKDDFVTLLADENLPRLELKLFAKAYRLAAIVHKNPGSALHLALRPVGKYKRICQPVLNEESLRF